MAMRSYTVHLSNNFRTMTEEAACPVQKYDHTFQPSAWYSKRPHVEVQCSLGTEGTTVNRISHFDYQGHVPQAPCMLGADRSTSYARAVQDLSWAGLRPGAVMLAFAVGVGAGLLVFGAGVLLGKLVVVHFKLEAAGINLVAWGAAYATIGAVLFVAAEIQDYRRAQVRLEKMLLLSQTFVALGENRRNEADIARCGEIVEEAYRGQDWALQHAASEFHGKLRQGQRAAEPAAEAKAA